MTKRNLRRTLRKSCVWKRLSALILCMTLVVGLSACGKGESGIEDSAVSDGAVEQDAGALIYEPEDLKLENEGEYSLYDVQFLGDMLCSQVYLEDEEAGGHYVLRCQSLTEDTVTDIPMPDNSSMWTLGEDGSLYMVSVEISGRENGGNYSVDRFLMKLNQQGEQIYRQNITELFSEDELFRMEMAVDAEGRTYILTDSRMLLFDEKGVPNGTVMLNLGSTINFCSFGRGSDGKVYISDGTGSTTLYEVDYEAGKLGTGHPDFPARGGRLTWDADGNYLTVDYMGVYRYNAKTQKEETVFEMVDTGIDSVTLSAVVSGLSDGRIAVVWQDWETRENGMVFMAGVSAPEPAEGQEQEQKQELVLGVWSLNPFRSAAVSEFNKNSDTYHITVKQYMKEGEIYLIDGATRLLTDIAAGDCPDIIEVKSSVLDWQNLVEKGVFEDLTPYLEQSGVFSRDDFFENVLDAYTHQGVLVTIPVVVQIQGFLGSKKELGNKTGWTIDEVIAFADAHPDAELLDYATSASILKFCLSYSMDSFVDWENGTCSFDGDEFKRLLQFAAGFSKSQAAGGEVIQKPRSERLRDGELLLRDVDMYNVKDIQFFTEPFQDNVTAMGYPSSDGSPVYTFFGTDCLAISARSEVKEAAWDFIENYMTKEGHRYISGFPVNKQKFDEMMEAAMVVELDDAGNEVVSQRVMDDGQYYTYRLPTQEEIDMALYMLDHGRLEMFSSTQLLDIINEEAEAFFQGQKTVDQVAETIQRRAAIYVSENS